MRRASLHGLFGCMANRIRRECNSWLLHVLWFLNISLYSTAERKYVILLFEYNLTYISPPRRAASIRYLPKYLLFYFCSFHVYFYVTRYSFYILAMFISFCFSFHIMYHFILHYEIPAAESGILSVERPRAMMNTTNGPVLQAALPASWTFFLGLNHTFTDIYNNAVEMRHPGNASLNEVAIQTEVNSVRERSVNDRVNTTVEPLITVYTPLTEQVV
jgi:hypothetical protein